eukprot:scaffold59200_cov63-Phaeocystis_antarctica.AAC.1
MWPQQDQEEYEANTQRLWEETAEGHRLLEQFGLICDDMCECGTTVFDRLQRYVNVGSLLPPPTWTILCSATRRGGVHPAGAFCAPPRWRMPPLLHGGEVDTKVSYFEGKSTNVLLAADGSKPAKVGHRPSWPDQSG